MVTRLYIPSSGSTAITPAADSSWEAAGAMTRHPLNIVKSQTSITTVTATKAIANTAYDICRIQGIYGPLAAQTISGNVKGVIRVSESNAAADASSQLVIRVIAPDGTTVRGTLLASDTGGLTDEWGTSLANRFFPRGGSGALSSVVAEDGDYLVIEFGVRGRENAATSRTLSWSIGDAGTVDLVDNQTGTAATDPWIEFDTDILTATPAAIVPESTWQWHIRRWDTSTFGGFTLNRWLTLNGTGAGAQGSSAIAQMVWPANGNFKAIKVRLETTNAEPVQAALYLNGNATALSVTIPAGQTTAEMQADIAVTAGDLCSYIFSVVNTALGVAGQVSIAWKPTIADEFCYVGLNLNLTGTAGQFAPLMSRSGLPSVDVMNAGGGVRTVIPFAGTIKAFYVALSRAPGAGTSYDMVLSRNSIEEASTIVNIADTNIAGNVSGLGIAISPGDYLSFKWKAVNGAALTARAKWGVVIVPDDPGVYAICGHANTGITSSRFGPGTGTDGIIDATEANVQFIFAPVALEVGQFCGRVGGPAGAGKSWEFRTRIAGADGNLAFTIAGAVDLSGCDTSPADNIPIDTTFGISMIASGTPTTSLGQAWALAVRLKSTPSCSALSVAYTTAGSFTRTGSNNTPWIFSFTGADDPENYQVWTGAARTGTMVASGTAVNGANVKNIAYNASGLINDTQTLYLSLDSTLGGVGDDCSFSLKRDDDNPDPSTSISVA